MVRTTATATNTRLCKKRKTQALKNVEAMEKNKKKTSSAAIENNIVEGDDIIYLNIGGETMAANRVTLFQVEGPFLAAMFSGRWESGMNRDKDGNVFLDFNPACFKLILNYLHAKRISVPEYPPPKPCPSRDDMAHYNTLVNYLGLRDEFKVERDVFSANIASNVEISCTGQVAKQNFRNSSDSCRLIRDFVLREKCCLSDRTQFRLEVLSMESSFSIFIGVMEMDNKGVSNTEESIYCDKGAYGWIGKWIWKNGKWTDENISDFMCAGMTYILTLDFDKMTLSLSNGFDVVTVKLIQAKNPKDEEYCRSLCVGFEAGMESEIRLL